MFFLGEPFTQEEMEEMLSVAVNTEESTISYKDYVPLVFVSTEEHS
jgi:Ca2+-binding EF-hand superfamily protein